MKFFLVLVLTWAVFLETISGQASSGLNQTGQISLQAVTTPSPHFYVASVNAQDIRSYVPYDHRDLIIVEDKNGKRISEIRNQLNEAIDLVSNDKTVFVLDQKEKAILAYDMMTGRFLNKIGANQAEKIRKPTSIGILQNNQIMIMDNSKNMIHIFDQTGKPIKSLVLNGIVSPVKAQTNGKDAIYVLDDKLQTIIKFDAEGKTNGQSRLQVDATNPGDAKGKIESFIVDPLGYVTVWNGSTGELETYSWKEQPVKVFVTNPLDGLNLSKAKYIGINPANYHLQVTSGDDKVKSFQYKVPVSTPENLFGFDINKEQLIVAFKPISDGTANRYGLVTQDRNGDDSLAYTSDEQPFVITEGSIFDNRSRRYKLVAFNPSGMGTPTSGFDNFFGLGNYLKTTDKPDEALAAYQNALRYMGRPQKMVLYVANAMMEIGKTLIGRNVDMIKGLNALKTAYNLNPREPAIQKGLSQGFDNLFWRFAAQENFSAIIAESDKVISQTFLKPHLLRSIDSISSTLEKLQTISTLTNARMLRTRMVNWAPEQTSVWKGVYQIDLSLFELKSKSGAPEYELQALINEAGLHINKAVELLQKSNRPFIDEYIQYLQTLDLSRQYADLEKNSRAALESFANRMDANQTLQTKELLASSLSGQKKYDDALVQYNFLLSQKPNETQWKLKMADIQYAKNNTMEALSLYKQLLLNDRDQPNYIAKIGLAELALGNYSEASIQLEKASRLNPSDKTLFGPLGEAYEKTNNLQKAIDQYKLAINLYQTLTRNSSAIGFKETTQMTKYYEVKLAQLYGKLSYFDQAAEVYQKLSIANAEDPTIWYGLGTANLSQGLVYDAVKAFQKAQSLEPNNAEYQSALQNAISLRSQVSKNEDPLSISGVKIQEIYPSLYVNYGDASLLPIGDVTVTNNTNLPISYQQITVEIPEIMKEPSSQPGGVIVGYSNNTKSLTAILSSKILDNTLSQKLQARVTINYIYNERPRTSTKTVPVTIYGRNSINWSDKRRLASFINVGPGPMAEYALASNDIFKSSNFVPLEANLAKAIQIYSMLDQEKLVYTPDPDLSYSSVSTNTNLIDFLQYPGETLLKKRGDCDDLVTLYCSALENAGIPTAFIDVPGHIFMAFDLNINPSQVEVLGFNNRDVIIYNGKTWLPVETTLLGVASFKEAWESAASRYLLELNQGHFPELVTMAEARQAYRPSLYHPINLAKSSVDKTSLLKEYTDQAYQIYGKINEGIIATMRNQYLYEPFNVFIKNKYAVYLGQSGRLSEAKDILKEALRLVPSNPSVLNNMGNILMQEGNTKEAIQNYEKSYSFDNADFRTAINLVKAYLKENDKASARKWMDIANAIDTRATENFKNLINQIK